MTTWHPPDNLTFGKLRCHADTQRILISERARPARTGHGQGTEGTGRGDAAISPGDLRDDFRRWDRIGITGSPTGSHRPCGPHQRTAWISRFNIFSRFNIWQRFIFYISSWFQLGFPVSWGSEVSQGAVTERLSEASSSPTNGRHGHRPVSKMFSKMKTLRWKCMKR